MSQKETLLCLRPGHIFGFITGCEPTLVTATPRGKKHKNTVETITNVSGHSAHTFGTSAPRG